MFFQRIAWCAALAGVLCLGRSHAQVQPAEQLLPDDIIAVFTVPNWQKLAERYEQGAVGKLWSDPAMKPFRDHFSSNLQTEFVKPLERELGVNLMEYAELLRGQVTLAITPPREGSEDPAGFMFLMDAGDKSDSLKSKLADLKKKWTDAGRKVQTTPIRDVEFSTIFLSSKDWGRLMAKAFPAEDAADEEESSDETEEPRPMMIGQFKSLLIAGDNPKAIEKMLARQGGGMVPPLAEKPAYQKVHAQLFRESLAHGWINIKPIYEGAVQALSAAPPEGMPAFSIDKLLPALGFDAIETIGAKVTSGNEGSGFEMLVAAPEGRREGLLKLLTLEKKESGPPPFVPADAVQFQRTRLDAQKAFATLESTLAKIDPTISGFLQLMLSSAGKDQDPNFDLKKSLIGNLGDDFIQYDKAPKSTKPEDLQQPPSLMLIGSPNPVQLLDAMRMITSLLPPPLSSAPLKEREFLGRKIYTLSMAAIPMDEDEDDPVIESGAAATRSMSFTTSAGYLAVSANDAILEEYLRSGENPPKPLREVPGFAEAAQKVGGTGNGYFSYENQAESMRVLFDLVKNNPEVLSQIPVIGASADGESGAKRFLDFNLLPSFERVAKYFGIAVASAGSTPDGFVLKALAPTPSGLR